MSYTAGVVDFLLDVVDGGVLQFVHLQAAGGVGGCTPLSRFGRAVQVGALAAGGAAGSVLGQPLSLAELGPAILEPDLRGKKNAQRFRFKLAPFKVILVGNFLWHKMLCSDVKQKGVALKRQN